jgi:hypothetical protein
VERPAHLEAVQRIAAENVVLPADHDVLAGGALPRSEDVPDITAKLVDGRSGRSKISKSLNARLRSGIAEWLL